MISYAHPLEISSKATERMCRTGKEMSGLNPSIGEQKD